MTDEERSLLTELRDGADRNAYTACDGLARATAHNLEKAGFAEWKGSSWGSQFWTITDAGRVALGGT